jgi:hypothetical protein
VRSEVSAFICCGAVRTSTIAIPNLVSIYGPQGACKSPKRLPENIG